MSVIRFTCLCSKRVKALEQQAGRRVLCPRCGRKLVVPPPKGPMPQPHSEEPLEVLPATVEASESPAASYHAPARLMSAAHSHCRPPACLPHAAVEFGRSIAPVPEQAARHTLRLPGAAQSTVAIVFLGVSMAAEAQALLLGFAAPPSDADVVGMAACLGLLPRIAAVLAFCFWIYRAHANLRLLRISGLTFSPGWAVAYFFIPFVNLWRPVQVVQEIWKASSPKARLRGPTSWLGGSSSATVGCWWACWIVSGLLAQIGGQLIGDGYYNDVSTYFGRFLVVLSGLLVLAAGALAIAMICRIRTRQVQCCANTLAGLEQQRYSAEVTRANYGRWTGAVVG